MDRSTPAPVLTAILIGLAAARGESTIDTSPPRPLGKGTVVVLRPAASRSVDGSLLIHFHGAVDTIRGAMERADTSATVVVVNQPGLSAAYATPVQAEPDLFTRLLEEPLRVAGADDADRPPPRWRRVTLSCFSAGYGAVRELLKDPRAFALIDAIVAADSIYAGLDETASDEGTRRVDHRDMVGFLTFAKEADAGKKVFVITHSSQPTPYASTTETADHLLAALGVERTTVDAAPDEPFPQVSRAGRGGFVVLGFAGASGPAHLFHLRSIERWWRIADELSADDERGPR